MDELIAILVGMVVSVGMVFATVGGIAYALTAYSCSGYETATGKPTKMIALECYIKDGDEWYVWEEYKFRFVTKGEMKN